MRGLLNIVFGYAPGVLFPFIYRNRVKRIRINVRAQLMRRNPPLERPAYRYDMVSRVNRHAPRFAPACDVRWRDTAQLSHAAVG